MFLLSTLFFTDIILIERADKISSTADAADKIVKEDAQVIPNYTMNSFNASPDLQLTKGCRPKTLKPT